MAVPCKLERQYGDNLPLVRNFPGSYGESLAYCDLSTLRLLPTMVITWTAVEGCLNLNFSSAIVVNLFTIYEAISLLFILYAQ